MGAGPLPLHLDAEDAPVMPPFPARPAGEVGPLKRPPQGSQLRIIGGSHRSRRLSFPELDGLRPTGDRVRETLFNWLQPLLPGAACLDLFAGSGALGFEAASRGAGRVVLVERAPLALRHLRENAAALGMPQVEIVAAEALEWLRGAPQPFDLVFLDPPFAAGLLEGCCLSLQEGGWLKPQARVYLEWDAAQARPQPPAPWAMLREKRAGQVAFALYQCP
jgi:16S rRNA (guanine966-N2)-methyltransferase